MTAHIPAEKHFDERYGDGEGYTVDCSCGERGVLWFTLSGARLAFLGHVVQSTTREAGWDEIYNAVLITP